MDEIKQYLDFIKENNLWDVQENMAHIRLILNKHLGTPPASFNYEGKTYSPKTFLKEIVALDMDDYRSVMSTKYFPFYSSILQLVYYVLQKKLI